MQRELLQEKSLNRLQGNSEKSINVDLSAKSRLIPYSTAAGMIGLNDLYIEERNACENYRMIFTVNPICTNVLFNAVTEPVYKEGSYSAMCLVFSSVTRDDTDIFPEGVLNMSGGVNSSFPVDQIAAVRDTEFSHARIGDFKYHCGYDIFNNHLLRSGEFEHVMMGESASTGIKNIQEFNTIFDFSIGYNGKPVERVINSWDGPVVGPLQHEYIRMYQLDNIKTMNTAFYDELRSVDGWYGFYNTGYINIPNATLSGESISINKIINNESSCSFIDLYPDRTLYSFIPKVNRFKKRLERNWDCTIVYPYKSDYDMFNVVNDNEANAVKVVGTKIVYNNVGDELIEMHSMLRHTLAAGDTVRLFYRTISGTTLERYQSPVRVIGVGDTKGNDENRCFKIKMSDVAMFCGEIPESGGKIGLRNKDGEYLPEDELVFFYRKIENGYENKYYFRVFKEMKNYEYVSCPEDEVISPVRAIREPSVITDESPDYIQLGNEFFKKKVRPLTYTQNKIAYAENIYGDRVAQVIFNDDICVSGLKDNLGRPLSRVYFTAIKTNRGHDEWYNSEITSADTIEYSHCFGDVTSGLDLPEDENSTEYNVRKLHNVFIDDCVDEDYVLGLTAALEEAPTGNYSGTPTPLESGITLDDFDEFYGDVVEFSKVKFKETVIEKVYHRFNTAQRECLLNKKFYDINYDELVGDLYDVGEVTED